MKRVRFLNSFIFLILMTAIIVSCDKEDATSPENLASMNSCEGCHTNYDLLKKIYTPVPDSLKPTGGCSGEAIFIEPYDRVYMGGAGFEEFKKTTHGKMKCTDCHNGNDKTADKEVAHSVKDGNFIKHPSTAAIEKCGDGACHANIAEHVENSIHNMGWGQKRKVTTRYGLAGANEFHQLPDKLQEGYGKNCATCHGSCGDCHVNRPIAGGGGLMNGHLFTKTPDMVKTCVACHVSRGGHAYLGVAVGTKPDVHLTKAGFTCLNCHTGNEVHGDGTQYETRFHVADLPQCTDCHSKVSTSNTYHSVHMNNLSCYVCHSQPYNNCGSCHIHGEGARIHPYQGFKIGDNPIKNTITSKQGTSYDFNKKWSLVRRTLSAPDSWQEYGTPLLTNFDAYPSFNYTSPHNIMKLTPQCSPEKGKACFDACHIIKDGDIFRNKELYLFESDLERDWEKSSSKQVTVDGKLPKSWGL